jgi:anti-sigma factor RsiW
MASLSYRARFSWDHRWTPGHLSPYLDGELRSRQRLRIERHVRDCADCRLLLAGLRDVVDGLHRLPAPMGGAEPGQVAAAVRRRLREPVGD